MKLRLWLYFLKQAFMNMMGNRVVHIIGMGTMVVSLLIFGTFLLLFVNLNAWIHGWGHSLSMSVYLQDGIDKTTRDRIASSIRDFPSAEIERYISKEDALKDLRKALGSEGPRRIKKVIEQIDGVDEVKYSEEWLKRFEGLMDVVRLAGFIIGGLLSIGVLFIVTNTIKLTIYLRKHEIEIQKLVGATDWFVKAPFMLEGFIQGLFSGVFSLLMLYSGYLFLSAKKVHLLGLTVLDFIFLPAEYVISIFLISVTLGLAGSFIAVGRFLAAESFADM